MQMQLIIAMDKAGQVTVSAVGDSDTTNPVEMRVMCYGLLEMAKEILSKKAIHEPSLIQPASTIPPMPRTPRRRPNGS
jgi:hypothetical protein